MPAARTISASASAASADAGPVHRIRRARPPRTRRAEGHDRAVRDADRRSPTMPSPPARSSAAASSGFCRTASSSSPSRTGWAATPATTRRRNCGQDRPRRAHPRARDLLQHRGKGLIVISSCGHVGIVNSVRQAQEVSGVQKVHAIVGGFHLGPAPPDYLKQVVAEIKKLDPDVVDPDALQRPQLHAGGAARRCRTASSPPRPAAVSPSARSGR